jgi:hypothetical protein
MKTHSITQLLTVDSLEKIQALNTLGIYTIRDMAEYAACRHAEFIMACFEQGKIEDADLENYIEASALTDDNLSRLDELDIVYLISVSEGDAEQLNSVFGVENLSELADFPPHREAQQIMLESIRGGFHEKPSAPPALIPKLIGSTHTQVRYSNYVREKELVLDEYELTYFSDKDEPEPAGELIDIFYRSQFKFYLGYLASIHQKWINDGTHLGEIIHSLALAPGESRNIVVLDWYRRQRSSREEDTTVSEELRAEFTQTRALNEVVQTTASEHLYGSTEVDSTTRTTGAGLVGGRGSGAATGGSVAADLTSLIGLPIKGASNSVASAANSIGGSLVYSNGSVQGTLRSETSGERTVTGELVQNISDATVQNASNVRSVMSTVIVEDEQAGRQRAQTRNITNYNHSHALTFLYYEMLHRYRIDTRVDRLSPMLFLPFGPITFTMELIKNYWYIFGKAIKRALPGRFFEFDQVVKDFNPENEAFDASGDVRITRVKISRTYVFSEPVRVKFYDANPEITLAIAGAYLNDSLRFNMAGSSTYIDYDILSDAENDLSSFGAVDSFEIDEGINISLRSDFLLELKSSLKLYLGNSALTPHAPVGTQRKNLEDNELGVHSKRDNLKDDVDNDLFSLINTNETLDLTMDIEYTIEDKNGQTQTVLQTIRKTYTFGQLKSEIDEEIADVTAYINVQLATILDINPADVIAEIEQHFNFYKYGYTKYLLANVEKEQTKDIVEHLGIYGTTETLALTDLIDPNPIGLTENLLVFKLREDEAGLRRRLGMNFFSSVSAPLFGDDVALGGNGIRQSVIRKGKRVGKFSLSSQPVRTDQGNGYSRANLTLYIDDQSDRNGSRAVEGTIDLIQTINGRQFTNPVAIQGKVIELDDTSIKIDYTANGAIQAGQAGTIDWTFDFPRPTGEDIAGIVNEYTGGLREYESVIRQRHHWESVFLPSSGVFAEAILGLSNASEYLNMRRFFNWQDSPIPNLAPSIQAVNVNQDYAQPLPEGLSPTVPVSVLNQIAPQQYPMPTSLTSALQAIQNGSMFTDMSKTEQLTTILGSLAELANNTAQLSGNLAGDAAANALNAAVALGQQVASMVGASMNTNVADPPKTLTAQGSTLNYLDEVKENSNGGPIAPTDQAGTGAVGAPVPTTGTASSNGSTGTNPAAETITINTITKDTVVPTKGQSDRYSIPRTGDTNHFQRYFDVSFSKPNDVNITNVKAELLDENGGVLQIVVDEAPGSARVALLNDTTLRVTVTFESIASQIASTPPPTDRIRYSFTLKGQKSNGVQLESEPKDSAVYYALWRMPDGFSRYSIIDTGLDDWASQKTYIWLENNRSLVTRINDISGEHARDIGHTTHFTGRDIDMFHVYTFPNGETSGGENYLRLKENVQEALNGDAQALNQVNMWASETRARFDSLIADNDVERIYYASGSEVVGPPKLTDGWAQSLLKNGTYTNPDNLSINLDAGAWSNASTSKMTYNNEHNDHFHLTLSA